MLLGGSRFHSRAFGRKQQPEEDSLLDPDWCLRGWFSLDTKLRRGQKTGASTGAEERIWSLAKLCQRMSKLAQTGEERRKNTQDTDFEARLTKNGFSHRSWLNLSSEERKKINASLGFDGEMMDDAYQVALRGDTVEFLKAPDRRYVLVLSHNRMQHTNPFISYSQY